MMNNSNGLSNATNSMKLSLFLCHCPFSKFEIREENKQTKKEDEIEFFRRFGKI